MPVDFSCRELQLCNSRAEELAVYMDANSKEYNKLSVDQFKRLIAKLPELRNQKDELEYAIRTLPKDKLNQLFVRDFAWAPIYELPFIQHIALVVVALNKHSLLSEAVRSEDPQQMLLDDFDKDIPEDWSGGYGAGRETGTGLAGCRGALAG